MATAKDKKAPTSEPSPTTAPAAPKSTRRKYVDQTQQFLEEALLGKRVTEIPPIIKMALYGRAGVGKTVFASTMPKPLLLAAESGTASIRDRMDAVTVIDVKTYDDLLLALEFLKKDTSQRFESVIIDSLSEAQRKFMDFLMDSHEKANMTLDMYGECTTEMRRIVREFCDLNINVLFIHSVRDDKDEEVGSIVHKCGMVGRMADEMPHYVDVVGYMAVRSPGPKDEDQTVKRFIAVQPMPKYDGKDRFGKLDRLMPPDFAIFQKMIFGEAQVAAQSEGAPAKSEEAPAAQGASAPPAEAAPAQAPPATPGARPVPTQKPKVVAPAAEPGEGAAAPAAESQAADGGEAA